MTSPRLCCPSYYVYNSNNYCYCVSYLLDYPIRKKDGGRERGHCNSRWEGGKNLHIFTKITTYEWYVKCTSIYPDCVILSNSCPSLHALLANPLAYYIIPCHRSHDTIPLTHVDTSHLHHCSIHVHVHLLHT